MTVISYQLSVMGRDVACYVCTFISYFVETIAHRPYQVISYRLSVININYQLSVVR